MVLGVQKTVKDSIFMKNLIHTKLQLVLSALAMLVLMLLLL